MHAYFLTVLLRHPRADYKKNLQISKNLNNTLLALNENIIFCSVTKKFSSLTM